MELALVAGQATALELLPTLKARKLGFPLRFTFKAFLARSVGLLLSRGTNNGKMGLS